ncbi:hypothetical protein WJX73_002403 [Symbiochloris irregularis]|uniref:RING-type domain-containing protein n=1 Tax=Symbiochloris irregularis TaxID=706552 RepID=A0AAW1NS84_9CHLO
MEGLEGTFPVPSAAATPVLLPETVHQGATASSDPAGSGTTISGSAGTAVEQESSGSDRLTCSICLDAIDPANLALIPSCDHQYCATCILHWTVHKESAWCPQCRVPFSRLQTYRALDGSLRDYPADESLCLLKRTAWFQEYVQAREKGKAPAPADASIPQEVLDWQDYSRFYDEYDDDEEVEAYYFSAAAGRARITLGNRRWGENGYVAAGRMHARPTAPARPAKAKAAKDSKDAAGAAKASPAGRRPSAPSPHTPPKQSEARSVCKSPSSEQCTPQPDGEPVTPSAAKGGSSSSGSGGAGKASSGGAQSSEGKNSGRRARRNARRAASDARTALIEGE